MFAPKYRPAAPSRWDTPLAWPSGRGETVRELAGVGMVGEPGGEGLALRRMRLPVAGPDLLDEDELDEAVEDGVQTSKSVDEDLETTAEDELEPPNISRRGLCAPAVTSGLKGAWPTRLDGATGDMLSRRSRNSL